MADIRLYYFPSRVRAEFIRLVLVASSQRFEDNIIAMEEWSSKKAETPYGQLPYMIYNGKKYGESVAIANFVAREFGYYGKTNLDGLRIDEVVQLSEDLKDKLIDVLFREKDEVKKAVALQNLKDEVFPKYLGFCESLLKQNGGSGFFVGNSLTLADFEVFDNVDTALIVDPEAIATFPSIKKLRSNVEAVPAISTYLASRPKRFL